MEQDNIPSAHVAAALIIRGGRFLICQRPEGKKRGLLWEFVGGKQEPGEDIRDTLIRECREELGITVSVGEPYMEVEHLYPDIRITMTLFRASLTGEEPKLLEHNDMRWITVPEIDGFEFCPADVSILEKLKEDYRKGILPA